MIVPIDPPLQGIAIDRFHALAKALTDARQRNHEGDLQTLLAEDLAWARAHLDSETSAVLAYEAAARVLVDLVRSGWQAREEGYGLELVAERSRLSGLTPVQILAEKHRTQAIFLPTVHAQLREPAVRDLAQRLEKPSARSGKKPVSCLIANGGELHARLLAARQNLDGGDDPLATAIRPYLQWVTADGVDEFTGHSLREIWRYFRYSWSIPQFSTPGRQMLYLVRDAAHPCHAVMGIVGLNNGALQMGDDREYHLGWSFKALKERLQAIESSESLAAEYEWMQEQLTAALEDVYPDTLVTADELANPDSEMITRLRRRAQEFDRLRDETLRELALVRSGNDAPVLAADLEELNDDHPPVAEAMLNLDAKPSANPMMRKARRHLVARKRAAWWSRCRDRTRTTIRPPPAAFPKC